MWDLKMWSSDTQPRASDNTQEYCAAWHTARTQTGRGQGSDGSWGRERGDCLLFLKSDRCELATLGTRVGGTPFCHCHSSSPPALMNFSEHSTPQWRQEPPTPPAPLCPAGASSLGQVRLRVSAAGPSRRRPAQTSPTHQVYSSKRLQISSLGQTGSSFFFLFLLI